MSEPPKYAYPTLLKVITRDRLWWRHHSISMLLHLPRGNLASCKDALRLCVVVA
ncbi:hypothetical protein ACS0TY_002873 [Phlomoides rotata]